MPEKKIADIPKACHDSTIDLHPISCAEHVQQKGLGS